MQSRTYSRVFWFAVLMLAVLHVCLPFTKGGLVAGHDTLRYVPRLVEFHENIRQGVLMPRWAPDLTLGQGQPLFIFSPPVPYYLGELWHLLGPGREFVTALNLGALTMILLSAFSMFLLCSLYFGERGGVLGAIAYVYSPYFHVDLLVRGAHSEVCAMAFYPLALYGFARHGVEKNLRALALGVAAFAAVILSHNPTALLFAPVLLGFAVFQAVEKKSWRLLMWQLGAVMLSLALAAFFWIPALWEVGNVHYSRLTADYFNYKLHFVELHQLVSTFWGYGGSVPGPDDQMSLSLGWSHVLLGAIAIAASFGIGPALRRIQWFFAAALVGFCVLMLPVSAFVWRILPLLQYTQFPWRLLAPASVTLGVLVASLGAIGHGDNLRMNSIVFVAALLLLAPNWKHAAANSIAVIKKEDWTPDAIARRGVETTAVREFETKWIHRVLPYDPERFRAISGDATVISEATQPTSWMARASSKAPSLIEARLLYFPGWTVFIDGTQVPALIAPETGRLRFDLPAGDHEVRLAFRRTGAVTIGQILSLVGVACLAGLWIRRRN